MRRLIPLSSSSLQSYPEKCMSSCRKASNVNLQVIQFNYKTQEIISISPLFIHSSCFQLFLLFRSISFMFLKMFSSHLINQATSFLYFAHIKTIKAN